MAQEDERASKRQKLSANGSSATPANTFSAGLFDVDRVSKLSNSYKSSKPYLHAVIPALFDDEFLRKARKEITESLSFREKETDIYKIQQTGDLTNLDGLPEAELAQLPTLLKLRDALYSKQFRQFLSDVTGCGPLSGSKTDMSCAEYSSGCYLLNHDDVIGTRRVSFILYLTEPGSWNPSWGGALELYDTIKKSDDLNVPSAAPSVSIPPSFNQFAFFEVQPGHSFHSVEEVAVSAPKDPKLDVRGGPGKRLSLSGWFHAPVEGEEGYEPLAPRAKSSLQQLYRSTLVQPVPYKDEMPLPLPVELSQASKEYLTPLINPAYLNKATLEKLRTDFVETSQLLLASFLQPSITDEFEKLLLTADEPFLANRVHEIDGLQTTLIPSHDAGSGSEWNLTGPPHIQRFLSLARPDQRHQREDASSKKDGWEETRPRSKVHQLFARMLEMYESDAFREWLAVISSLVPLDRAVQARRFRPGLDYTLARGEPDADAGGEARLDVMLHLTPRVSQLDKKAASSSTALGSFEDGQVGGWDLYIAPDTSSDEATYGPEKKTDDAEQDDDDDDDDDDGPLLALPPGWNTLSLVLRDPGVMRFTKYVSTKAEQSRFDVYGEWHVGMVETDEGQEDEA